MDSKSKSLIPRLGGDRLNTAENYTLEMHSMQAAAEKKVGCIFFILRSHL